MLANINLERYDRQNRTYGKEATMSLSNSTVVVIGLSGGLATETCKNLLLSGVQNLIIVDDGDIVQSDLQSGFYYKENDIGNNRCSVLTSKLTELNPCCNIQKCSNFEVIDFTNKVVILHNSNKNIAVRVNQLCRTGNSKFVWVRSKGVSGTVFVDCGNQHVINDLTGEVFDPVQLESISSDGTVVCAQNNSHDFQNGDTVQLVNISGENIDFLQGREYLVNVNNKFKFQLDNFSSEGEFRLTNGTAIMIKKPVTINHLSLDKFINFKDVLEESNNFEIEGWNQEFDRKVIDYFNDFSDVPDDSWCQEMEEIVSKYEDKNMKKIVRSSNQELMPVISVVGSLASMEVIKSITNKFKPISQWMVYSDSDLVPDEKPSSEALSGLENLLGSNFKTNIETKNWLMVGCGAIGCEMLKNLAKLNMSADGGNIYVTDPDHIEQSNLSRQFLFRNQHIGKSKSKTAAESILMMNSNVNINAMEDKMSSDNQHLIDAMAPNLFGVINALDNVEARRYMDEQCFRYGLPLFESGTQGMKGNTQPVIPFVTETYSNSSDPPQEKSFPVCTIKNFPNQPHHTIHWAMDYFEQFQRGPKNANSFATKKNAFFETLSSYDCSVAKEDVYKYFVKYQPKSWRDCARWASDMFLELYRDQIIQLLHNFPRDSVTSEGELFWSKGKRCPTEMEYDLTNRLVTDFLVATTHLLAQTMGFEDNFETDDLVAELTTYQPYEFTVDTDKKIASNDSELEHESESKTDYVIPDDVPTSSLVPLVFEKDDDTNWHIAFITAASNLRSFNYGIPASSFDETKGIAGKIVPAVATTTSIVSGLITIELMKYCSLSGDDNKIERYKSWFVSLANNILVASEPMPAPMLTFGDVKINSWTKFDLSIDMTLENFIKLYEEKFKTKIAMVLYGTSMLFANFMPCTISGKLLSEIFKEKYDINLFSSNVEIIISSEEDDLELPVIQVNMKKSLEEVSL